MLEAGRSPDTRADDPLPPNPRAYDVPMTMNDAVGRVRVYLQVIFVGLTTVFGEGSAATTVCFFLCVTRRALLFPLFPCFFLSLSLGRPAQPRRDTTAGRRPANTTRRSNEIKRNQKTKNKNKNKNKQK